MHFILIILKNYILRTITGLVTLIDTETVSFASFAWFISVLTFIGLLNTKQKTIVVRTRILIMTMPFIASLLLPLAL